MTPGQAIPHAPPTVKTMPSAHPAPVQHISPSPTSSEGNRSWRDTAFPLSESEPSPSNSTPASRRSSCDSNPPPPPPPTTPRDGNTTSERALKMLADMTSSDMTSSDKASSSLKLGGDGPLSPTLKLMMQKYAADDAAHSRKISESSDHSNTSAVPPHPVVNGHHSIPPPPPPPAFGTSSVA